MDTLNRMTEAFSSDFEDGVFDGKDGRGKPIVIGSGANQIILSATPLTTTLLPGIVAFVQTGGNLAAGGITTSSAPSITDYKPDSIR